MYSGITPNQPAHAAQMPVYAQQQPIIKSSTLIIFGSFNITISSLMILFCFWAATKGNIAGFVGIASAIYHIKLGALVIIGGRDTVRRRGFITASLVMAIIGASVFVLTTITLSSMQWSKPKSCTWICDHSTCRTVCRDSQIYPYVVILVLSIIEGVVDVVISSLSCRYVCRRCNNETSPGTVQQPGHVTEPTQSYQTYPSYVQQYPNQMQQQSFTSGSHLQYPGTRNDHYVVNEHKRLL